jgi:putative SOS response-associated peptidase YedK
MCGRYSLTHSAEEIAGRFNVDRLTDFEPRYNVAPTQVMPVVRADEGARELSELRWGLIPFWAKEKKIGYRMINARSETAAKKPAFRAAFRRRRCLIPVDSFYEWVELEGQKWPIRIRFGDGELGAFAGLWERWTDEDEEVVESYTILTTEAHEVLVDVHDRMPLWAPAQYWDSWLFDDEGAEDVMAEMIDGFPADQVRFEPVSRELNKAGNEGPHLVEPVEMDGLPQRR